MASAHSIRIPVHGFVEISDWERDIINHPVFQRLRRVRQLAFSEHLYPGSVHTRFEHSIGVMHVATRLFDAIERRHRQVLTSEFGHTPETLKRSRSLVRLAALLHDVGHSPFSHTGEGMMPASKTGKQFEHEDYSAALIKHNMKDVIDDHSHNKDELHIQASEVADFYMNKPTIGRRHLLWCDLVNGQLDADRMDYLLRDSLHCGVSYGSFDLDRIVDTVTLVRDEREDESSAIRLGLEYGGIHVAEQLIVARYFMFSSVYFHRVRKAYDHHAAECLKASLPSTKGCRQLPPPDTEHGRKRFIELDDWSVMAKIKAGKCGRHGEVLMNHRHDRCIDRTQEVPSIDDFQRFEEAERLLVDQGFAPWVARADKSWYKAGDSEVQIADRNGKPHEVRRAIPLTDIRDTVKQLKPTAQRFLYVPIEQECDALQCLKENEVGLGS